MAISLGGGGKKRKKKGEPKPSLYNAYSNNAYLAVEGFPKQQADIAETVLTSFPLLNTISPFFFILSSMNSG